MDQSWVSDDVRKGRQNSTLILRVDVGLEMCYYFCQFVTKMSYTLKKERVRACVCVCVSFSFFFFFCVYCFVFPLSVIFEYSTSQTKGNCVSNKC